jgi:hypothetical protein
VTLSGLSSATGQIVEVTVSVTHDTVTTATATVTAYKTNY